MRAPCISASMDSVSFPDPYDVTIIAVNSFELLKNKHNIVFIIIMKESIVVYVEFPLTPGQVEVVSQAKMKTCPSNAHN